MPCSSFRQGGGRVVLITNAPRAAAPIIDMLDDMGVPRDAYDALVSSGDVTRAMIAPYRGKIIHHVGPPTDRRLALRRSRRHPRPGRRGRRRRRHRSRYR